MGGDKPFPSKKYLGDSKSVKQGINNLKKAVKEEKTKEIPLYAFDLLTKARKPLNFSAYSNKLFPEIIKNYFKWKKEKDLTRLKIEISKSWDKIKKKNKISLPKEVERIIIENAVKTIGGRK